jgi:hypothetical protein
LEPDDLLLRFVAFDVAFIGNLLADGLDGLSVGLVSQRAVNDRLQLLDGRLGQSLLDRLLHFPPLGVAGLVR